MGSRVFSLQLLPVCGMLNKIAQRMEIMEKKDIIAFFDCCAPTWDAEMIKSDVIIGKILDNA